MRSWESKSRNASHDWLEARHDAETVPCPECAAEPGEHCRHPDTGDTLPYPAHPSRIKASEEDQS